MRDTSSKRRRSAAAVIALLAACAVSAFRAEAYDGVGGWTPFRDQTGSSTAQSTYDRAFAREWENNPPRGYPTLSPANIEPMKRSIRRYTDIAARGGWAAVPDVQLQAGVSHGAVSILRQRLLLSGDLKDDSGSPDYFDVTLEKAVRRFQASNGLTPSGLVEKNTIAALNVAAATRLKQLRANLARLQEYSATAGKRYVVVNVPAAQIEAVENDRIVSRHSGVVGKIDRPTPLLRSAVHEMNFNPVWTLPPTVIEKDLIPKGREMQRKGQSVLVKYGIDAYDGNGKKLDPNKLDWNSGAVHNLQYRQQPGKDNPLGFLKINFHNSHAVYMHDTPSESLFGRNFRAASSGCVRVAGIEALASWMLLDNGGWSSERIAGMRESGERLDLKLRRPVQLYFVYFTAWATEDGIVHFRRDLYQKDGVGATASAY